MEYTIKVNIIKALIGIYGDIEIDGNIPPTQAINAANNIKNVASGDKATIFQLLINLQNKNS